MIETCHFRHVQFRHGFGSLGLGLPIPSMAQRQTRIELIRTLKDEDESSAQTALARVARIGPAAETLRRMSIERLKGHMEAFYEHGTLPDILLLCDAFDAADCERNRWSLERAWLIESILELCNC